jgi:hypothetical protein
MFNNKPHSFQPWVRPLGLCCCLTFFMLACHAVEASQQNDDARWSLQWGGPGFDDALDQRYSARMIRVPNNKAPNIIELKIDTKATAYSLGRVRLVSSDGKTEAASVECRKLSKHESAPWGCDFLVTDLKKLPETVSLIAHDGNGKAVLNEQFSLVDIRKRFLTDPPANDSSIKERARPTVTK